MSDAEITIPGADGLSQEVYRFWFWDQRNTLFLDTYERQTKLTRRHKWRTVASYARIGRSSRMTADQVPMPADLFERAKADFVSKITVGLWPERGQP